jgi:hypothetical protein
MNAATGTYHPFCEMPGARGVEVEERDASEPGASIDENIYTPRPSALRAIA